MGRIMKGAVYGVFLGVLISISMLVMRGLSVFIQRYEGKGVDFLTGMESDLLSAANSDMALPENQVKDIDTVRDEDFSSDKIIGTKDKFIRFHIKANSNSDQDIVLKYTVRDAILKYISGELDGADSKENAERIIRDNIDSIEKIAKETVKEEGYDYEVNVEFGKRNFPIREYGGITLPAGIYDALTIDIGGAKGENFWCMLYPLICITDDSIAIVSEEDKEELKNTLTDEEIKALFNGEASKKEVHLGLKLLTLLNN